MQRDWCGSAVTSSLGVREVVESSPCPVRVDCEDDNVQMTNRHRHAGTSTPGFKTHGEIRNREYQWPQNTVTSHHLDLKKKKKKKQQQQKVMRCIGIVNGNFDKLEQLQNCHLKILSCLL